MAVSLDPFRNIVNVQWGGGVFVIRVAFQNLYLGNDPRFPTAHDEEIPPGTAPWTSMGMTIPWRVFCRVMDPLDASGMIPQIFVGLPTIEADINLISPIRFGTNHTTGNYKWAAWKFEEYYDYFLPPQTEPVPEDVFNINRRPITDLPEKAPEVFLPNRLKGIQCGYTARCDANVQIAFSDPPFPISVGRANFIHTTELIWTVNLSLLPPPFTPDEIAYRFRLDFVQEPTFTERVQQSQMYCQVASGMYKPPDPTAVPSSEGETIHGTIEPSEQSDDGLGMQVSIGQSGAAIDILVLRGEPWTGGPPKVLMTRVI